jgi:hypothetical protein
VVDVAEDRDHRRPRFELRRIGLLGVEFPEQDLLLCGLLGNFQLDAEIEGD